MTGKENEHRDENGHFASKENDGGACNHNGNTSEYTAENKTKYNFKLTDSNVEMLRKKFKNVFTVNKGKENFEKLVNDIKSCGDNEQKLFLDIYENVVGNVWQAKGKGYFSSGSNEIILDKNDLTGEESKNYVRNGVAFHETGHAIDAVIGRRMQFAPRGRGWASYSYAIEIDGEYRTMEDELNEDLKNIDFDAIIKDIDGEIKKEQDDIDKEDDVLREKLLQIDDHESEEYFEITKRRNDLFYNRNNIIHKTRKDWGDVSDIYSGFTKNKHGKDIWGLPNVNFGHPTNYWNGNTHNLVVECFAEMYQGKTVNLASYEKMKKYFPRANKFFERILEENGKQ